MLELITSDHYSSSTCAKQMEQSSNRLPVLIKNNTQTTFTNETENLLSAMYGENFKILIRVQFRLTCNWESYNCLSTWLRSICETLVMMIFTYVIM